MKKKPLLPSSKAVLAPATSEVRTCGEDQKGRTMFTDYTLSVAFTDELCAIRAFLMGGGGGAIS